MGLSPSAVVVVSIVGAMFSIGIGAVIHRMYTGPPDDSSPGRRFYNRDNSTSEQQDRIAQVRAINNIQAWDRAREAREEMGLSTPYGYPGIEWLFSPQGTMAPASLAGTRAAMSQPHLQQDHRLVEQDVLRCPNRIGHAYQHVGTMYPRDDTTDTNVDEYGMPLHPNAARFSQRRSINTDTFSQQLSAALGPAAAAQRLARPVRQYVPPVEARTANEEGWEMDDLVNRRSSSVYSTIDLNSPPRSPPAAYVRESMHMNRQTPRVHHLVERWEAANGR